MIFFCGCRVPLNNGGSLVIEQTEALVSIDVNGGHSMFGQGTSQEKAILEVNLEAAKQVCDASWNFPGCSSLLYLFPVTCVIFSVTNQAFGIVAFLFIFIYLLRNANRSSFIVLQFCLTV